MKNPKVGERCSFQYNTYLEKHILRGEITKVYDDGQVRIKCDAESTAKGDFLMLPKYCVRLKPKRLRRRVWIPEGELKEFYGSGVSWTTVNISREKMETDDIEFSEKAKKR